MNYKPRKAVVIGIELHDKNGVVQPDVGLVLRLLPHDGEFYGPEEQSEVSERPFPSENEGAIWATPKGRGHAEHRTHDSDWSI